MDGLTGADVDQSHLGKERTITAIIIRVTPSRLQKTIAVPTVA